MTRFKLALALETLGLPLRPALDAAARLTLDGVQADAVGPLAPDELGPTARRELRTLLRAHLVELVALNCPLRRGLDNAEALDARLAHLRKVANLAAELGCPRLVMPMPALPRETEKAREEVLRQSLSELARIGDATGVSISLEVGLDPPATTRDYLASFDTGSLRVNLDPAAILVGGGSPVDAVLIYGDRIDHVQARDARQGVSGGSREVPLGEGDVDWNLLVATLDATGYRAYLTVDTEIGRDRAAVARHGVEFLRRFVPPPRR